MSTNEASCPDNAPGPPSNHHSNDGNGRPGAQLSASSSGGAGSDAPTGVQQEWYSHTVVQALRYAQNAAVAETHEQGPVPGVEAQQGDTFTWLLQRLAPDNQETGTGRREAALPSMLTPGPNVTTSATDQPQAPDHGVDMDMPLMVGSHPYAARPGSSHRRRIGAWLGSSPDPEAAQADPPLVPAAALPDCPGPVQGAPLWEEKQTVCFYCKAENWPRRSFCYMCRRDFASGWWHPDGCNCGDC